MDRDGLYGLIAAWAKARTYQTTEIIWLLSSAVIFEQTFADSDRDHWDTKTVQFLDSVPFEVILSRVFNPLGGRHVIATNQDFINVLTQGFAMQGYLTRAVVSAKSLGIDSPMTSDAAKHAVNNLNQLLRDNLITPTAESATYRADPTGAKQASNQASAPKSSLPVLLGIFLTLLAILLIVILLNK